jgi:hypothetical protein
MTKYVGAEHHFEAVFGLLAAGEHGAGVEDEPIDGAVGQR